MIKSGYIAGLALSVSIAMVSFLLSGFHQAIDFLVVLILFGIILGNLLRERERLPFPMVHHNLYPHSHNYILYGFSLYPGVIFYDQR